MNNASKKKPMSPVFAGIAGVVAGATAAAAAVLMSNKKNQRKVTGAIADAKEDVSDYVDSMKSQPVVKKSVKAIKETVKSL